MPGVLMLEAMAQACALLSFDRGISLGDDQVFYFVGIDGARFKRPVEPGDQLILHAAIDRARAASTVQLQGHGGRRGGLRSGHHVHHAGRGLNPLSRCPPRGDNASGRPRSGHGVRWPARGRRIIDATDPSHCASTRAPSWILRSRSARTPSSARGCASVHGGRRALRVIEGHTTLGQDNRIFQFASIGGAILQDKKYAASRPA